LRRLPRSNGGKSTVPGERPQCSKWVMGMLQKAHVGGEDLSQGTDKPAVRRCNSAILVTAA